VEIPDQQKVRCPTDHVLQNSPWDGCYQSTTVYAACEAGDQTHSFIGLHPATCPSCLLWTYILPQNYHTMEGAPGRRGPGLVSRLLSWSGLWTGPCSPDKALWVILSLLGVQSIGRRRNLQCSIHRRRKIYWGRDWVGTQRATARYC